MLSRLHEYVVEVKLELWLYNHERDLFKDMTSRGDSRLFELEKGTKFEYPGSEDNSELSILALPIRKYRKIRKGVVKLHIQFTNPDFVYISRAHFILEPQVENNDSEVPLGFEITIQNIRGCQSQ